jgi:hypothetical protein
MNTDSTTTELPTPSDSHTSEGRTTTTSSSWRWAYGENETNMRGENAVEAYKTAFAEAFAPMIRDYFYGHNVDFDKCEDEFRRQLAHRGFTHVTTDETTDNGE